MILSVIIVERCKFVVVLSSPLEKQTYIVLLLVCGFFDDIADILPPNLRFHMQNLRIVIEGILSPL